MRKLIISVVVIISIVIAAVVVFYFGISPFAKNYIEKHSIELTGRKIKMNNLDFNCLNGKLKIDNLSLFEKSDTSVFFRFDTLNVQVNLLALIKKEVIINYINLSSPAIQIVQNDTVFNFNDLITRFSSADNTTSQTETNAWKIGINNINIKTGKINYSDIIRSKTWEMDNFKLFIPGIYFDNKSTNIGLELKFTEGGALQATSDFDINKQNFKLNVQLADFSLKNTIPYAKEFLNISNLDGIFTGDLNISGNIADLKSINIDGNAQVKQFSVSDLKKKELLSINDFKMKLDKAAPFTGEYLVDNIDIIQLNTALAIHKESHTFSKLLKPQQTSNTESKPLKLNVKSFNLTKSSFTFADHLMSNPFQYKISDIAVHIKDFNPDRTNNYAMQAQLADGGKINLKWKSNFNDLSSQNLVVNLINVNLKDFTPYSLNYFGFPLKSGVFTYISENNINNYDLQGKNKVDIYRCTVGSKNKAMKPEFNIPMKAALYILKDKDKKIKLDLPVTGNINSPEFSYKKIILKTLTNLLVKVAVSPVNFLANSLGLNSEGLEHVEMNPLQTELNSEQYAKLNDLASIIKLKPEMSVLLKQEFDMAQAIKDYALFDLKKKYYIYSTSDKSELEAADYLTIYEIPNSDIQLNTFADSLTNNIIETKKLIDKALMLYPADSVRFQINELSERRNQVIADYLTLKQGVNPASLRMDTTVSNSKNKNRYKIEYRVIEDTTNLVDSDNKML